MTRRVRLIGIGAGHPDQLTVEAIKALDTVDVFLVTAKGEDDPLVAARDEILRRHLTRPPRVVVVPDPPRDRRSDHTHASYGRAVDDWHQARAAAYADALAALADGETAGFLVWGDPSLYDSTIRVVERVARMLPLEYDVVPGVSSVQVLAARHRIVLNRVGEPVTVTTGRRLPDAVQRGLDNIVVMLDGDLACRSLLESDGGWEIWWGANLGTSEEQLVAGPLGEVMGEIERRRAMVRQSSGWVMDTYLLRRCEVEHDGPEEPVR